MTSNTKRLLVFGLVLGLIIVSSACEAPFEKTKKSRLEIFQAVAAPSGKVYTAEATDYLGKRRHFILSKDGRKTEIYPAFDISKNVTKNGTMLVLRYDEKKKRDVMYTLSSRGKIIKYTPLPKNALAYHGRDEKSTGMHARGEIADNAGNFYVGGLYAFGKGSREHYETFLKKISPGGKVTDIATKHMIQFVGNTGDEVCMAIDAENNFYVSEVSRDGGLVIERIDPRGRGAIVAEVPGGVNPDIINVDRQGNVFAGVRMGTWFKFKKNHRKGIVIVSGKNSGPFRAKKPIKPETYGDTGLWLMKIEYMWRLERQFQKR